MKPFLKNTFFFILILYGSLGILLVSSNQIIRSEANFKMEPSITKIIIGNSHPTAAFNDSLISNFRNLASPGENYFYGYLKLKKIIQQNPQLDTVFVEINPETILIREDDKFWKKNYIPKYLPFLSVEDHLLLAYDNNLGYQQEVIKGIISNFKRIVLNDTNYIDSIGGYRHVSSSKIKKILDSLKNHPQAPYTKVQKTISKYDSSYLKSLVELCKTNGITPIFVRSPYHQSFLGRSIENQFQTYRKDYFDDVIFLDFQDFPIDDSEFKDQRHLNSRGAQKFSLWFDKQNIIKL